MSPEQPDPETEAIPLTDDPDLGPIEPDNVSVPPDEPDEIPVSLPDREPAVASFDFGQEIRASFDSLGNRLDRRLDELQTLFDREIRAEATREKVVDRLHAELQDSKQDLLLNTLRPIFIDLIQLHDDIGKVAVFPESADDQSQRLIVLMQGFQQGIEDILYRQGVEPFQNEGDAFDPRRQRAITTVPTDDPARNKTVAARLRKGFLAREKVIRPEVVSVYALKK